MKHFKFLLGSAMVILAAFFIYSCAKDSNTIVPVSKEQTFENRMSGSACSPKTLYPILIGCTDYPKSIQIDFALGLDLYSTNSLLYQLCPGVQFNVTYTYTVCNNNLPTEIHYVHNLNYNLADIIAACPALQTEITNQTNLGNLTAFLDKLDFDISKQVEFTEAYNAAVIDLDKYKCGPNGGQYYNVKFIQNTCYKWVPFLDGPKDRPIPAYRKETCNESICCIRLGQYCVDGFYNGQPNLQGSGNSSYERTEGECPLVCTHECGDTSSF
jgi:hypothetical protein